MYIDFFLDRFRAKPNQEAMIWQDKIYTYGEFLAYVENDVATLRQKISGGKVVGLEADFSPRAVSLLLALIGLNCIIVPLTANLGEKRKEYKETARVEIVISVKDDDTYTIQETGKKNSYELIDQLRHKNHPGLIIFTSGSTGKGKAAVHDFLPLLEKFKTERKPSRMIAFLLFDHISGINTALYAFAGKCLLTVKTRSADAVCQAIERYKVNILPVSPSFLNLILLSESYKKYDMSSLKLVTYGTEPMLKSSLLRFCEIFPNVKIRQMYGLSETGIICAKSKSSDSLWIKIGGEDIKTRVMDGLLEIKTNTVMLGYLNAPSPFTEDGWFKTEDEVLVDGEYYRILGRRSEMINVGGQKVFPVEVESVIQEMEGVEDVSVSGEANQMLGNVVKARVKLTANETASDFKNRMRTFCKGKLEAYKIPQKVELVDHLMIGERLKKMRR
ncbi:MAG: long-chain fatty acid--CoA ligase [Selenomonadaceae bacterium]|nr:long-chain fatty acid--CoA ligase [Selenomonadaceae bacterium]